MQLITAPFGQYIENEVIPLLQKKEFPSAAVHIEKLCDRLHDSIPDSKRISYGIVFVVRSLGEYFYSELSKKDIPLFAVCSSLLACESNFKSRALALCMLSFYALQDYKPALPFFEKAAADENWELREMAQMFFRKMIKKHPSAMHKFLEELVGSENPFIRRFVAETLRPVQENKWFYQQPQFSLIILRKLFKEAAPYPRTAVGNNLSDLSRKLPELIYSLVQALVACGDRNAYWIACRACRNLVKKEPLRVMDILKTDEYKYKKGIYRRSDYQRN